MSYTVSGHTITMTRGDTASVIIVPKYSDGEVYIPQPEDTVKFTVKRAIASREVMETLLEKEIPTDTMELVIEPEDTKTMKFGDYVFDVQLTFADGDVDTFITDGKLKITPEVGD